MNERDNRMRLLYRGDMLATVNPEGHFLRWKVTDFEADDFDQSERTGLATDTEVAWLCAITAAKEMRGAR